MNPDPHEDAAQAVSEPAARSYGLILHPATGEVLELATAPTSTLADWRLRVLELERELAAVKSDLDVEMARRLDLEATRSARVGDFEIEVQAPTISAWDEPLLSIALEALVQDGRISRGVAERAIKVEVKRSVRAREAQALERHADPEVRESVLRCRQDEVRAHRRVSVRLAHS